MPASGAPHALGRLGRRWLGAGLGLVAASALATAPAPAGVAVDAKAHLRAAKRQAHGDHALSAAFQRACSAAATPKTAALAVQQLRQTEADHQNERSQSRPRQDRLLLAVVMRGCAAWHATRLQPGASYPVWLHTRVRIEGVKPAAAGFEIQAWASTVDGPVSNSRITFSRGLHHACFAPTDATGKAACVMVDSHPHGDASHGGAEAHEGPFVATLAGSVSPNRVELPTVEFREVPVFASQPPFR